jgi:glucose-1-phosphate thymidylyltransferase
LAEGTLGVTELKRGTAWLDSGTFDSLHAASAFIKIIEERQGFKVSCVEEIAWRNGWINDTELTKLSLDYGDSEYGVYLSCLLK